MKSKYEKPLLAMETFSLTQDTARDCANTFGNRANQSDSNSCRWDLGGGTSIFNAGVCTIDALTINEAYCYNNPTEGQYIFHS